MLTENHNRVILITVLHNIVMDGGETIGKAERRRIRTHHRMCTQGVPGEGVYGCLPQNHCDVGRNHNRLHLYQIQGQGRAFRSHCRTPLRPHHEPLLPGAGRIRRTAGRTAAGKYGEGIRKLYAGNFAVLL